MTVIYCVMRQKRGKYNDSGSNGGERGSLLSEVELKNMMMMMMMMLMSETTIGGLLSAIYIHFLAVLLVVKEKGRFREYGKRYKKEERERERWDGGGKRIIISIIYFFVI